MMKKIYIIILSALAVAFQSCSFLDVEPQVLTQDNTYETEEDVINGLAGVYGTMNNEAFYGNYYSLQCSNLDDLSYFNRSNNTNYVMYFSQDASTSEIYGVWTAIYAGIKCANNFMDAVSKTEFDPDGTYCNEARFLRAYYHFIAAQTFGDVPMRTEPVKDYDPDALVCAATPQEKILEWVIQEMEACITLGDTGFGNFPSRVNKYTMEGILARVCLFMAGESVEMTDIALSKQDYIQKAMTYSKDVIDSGLFDLNPDYSEVFINYITDTYDTQYRESMWEVDFLGDRSSAVEWTNGRIGDLIGLQGTGSSNYLEFNSNYSYGWFNGSPKLWYLYTEDDRTDSEKIVRTEQRVAGGNANFVYDERQLWNLPPYNYAGSRNQAPFGTVNSTGDDAAEVNVSRANIDRTVYNAGVTTTLNQTAAGGLRNAGKYRREVIYEGHKDAKMLYTSINYPILRYSDVLLMYAEAYNELNGPSEDVFNDTILEIRNRAGVATRDYSSYSSQSAFRQLIRNERGRELCFESLRKYDLIRWGIFVEAMHGYSNYASDPCWTGNPAEALAISTASNVSQRHIYQPIPSIELGVNTALTQNPLW